MKGERMGTLRITARPFVEPSSTALAFMELVRTTFDIDTELWDGEDVRMICNECANFIKTCRPDSIKLKQCVGCQKYGTPWNQIDASWKGRKQKVSGLGRNRPLCNLCNRLEWKLWLDELAGISGANVQCLI